MVDSKDNAPVAVRQRKPVESVVEPLALRPQAAWRFLGISKSFGYELLKSGVLERVRLSERVVAITMTSLKAFAAGRGSALPEPEPTPTPPAPRLVRRPRS